MEGINLEDKSGSFGKRLGSETIAPPAKIPKLVSVNHSLATIEAFMKSTVGHSAEPAEEMHSKMEEDVPVVQKVAEKKESPRSQSDLPPSTPQSEYGIPILENLIPEFPQIGKRKPQPKKSAKPPSKTQSPPKRSLSRPPQPQQPQPEPLESMIPAPDYDDSPSFVPASPPPSQSLSSSQKDRSRTNRASASTPSSVWREVNSGDEFNRILADAGNKLVTFL